MSRTRATTQFPELYQFLGGYFTQDWTDFYDWEGQTPNFEAVVRYYKSIEPPSLVLEVAQELQDFLALSMSTREFERVLIEEFIVWYTPRSRGMTKREWLQAILQILREPDNQSTLRRLE